MSSKSYFETQWWWEWYIESVCLRCCVCVLFKTQMQQCLITKKNLNYYSWIPSNYTFETLENESRCYLLLAATPCCTVQWTVQHGAALWTVRILFSSKKQRTVRFHSHCTWTIYLFIYFSKSQLTFFFEKPVQLINFTCTVHVNVNSNFFLKKIV